MADPRLAPQEVYVMLDSGGYYYGYVLTSFETLDGEAFTVVEDKDGGIDLVRPSQINPLA